MKLMAESRKQIVRRTHESGIAVIIIVGAEAGSAADAELAIKETIRSIEHRAPLTLPPIAHQHHTSIEDGADLFPD